MLPGTRLFSLCASAIERASKSVFALAVLGLLLAGGLAAQAQVSAPAPYDFGTVAANSSATHTLTFSFTGAATIGSVSVVTQGLAGKDFQPQANDTSATLCAAQSYSSGDTCTVDVTFSPLAQGHRIGQIQLLDSTSKPLATAYISGWGQGAVLVSGRQTISTIAGMDNTPGYNYDPVTNTSATTNKLNSPRGIIADVNGNIYVADAVNRVIRKITPAGTISTVAGVQGQTPASCPAFHNALAQSAAFSEPGGGMAIDSAGNLIVGDYQLHCVYSINLQAGTITTILGQAGPELGPGDTDANVPGPASAVEARLVGGVGVDGAGNIYVGTSAGHVLKIDPTLYVTVAAGTTVPGPYSGEGGPATSARLDNPYTIIFDAAGEMIFTDLTNNRVLRVDSLGNIHTVLGGGSTLTANLPASGSSSNILGTQVNAGFLWGVAIDGPGNLYATASQYGQIIEVDPNGYAYLFSGTALGTTLGVSSDSGDGGSPGAATLSDPGGLWITPGGDMLVADGYGHDVRRIGYTPLSQTSLNFAATQIGHKSSDSPKSATLTNVGDAALTFATPASGTNPTISPSFSVDAASTCQQPSAAPTEILGLDASCSYAVDFIPVTSGPISGSLTLAGNVFGGTASVALSGTGIKVVDTLVVTAPATVGAGTSFTVHVTAYLNGSVSTSFTGPLTITSKDVKAILPASVNLVAGVGSFSATLETTGIQTITATDVSGTSGISNNILVTAAAPNQVLPVSGSPQSTQIGTAFPAPLKVEVLDQYGNPVPGATVSFSAPASGASATFSPASCSTSTTAPVGYCSVVATANGTASSTAYNASASASGVASPAVFSLTNLQAATTLTVTPSATSLVYGQPVSVSAAISPASAGGSVPTGSVTFYDGVANALSPNAAVSAAAASYSVSVPAVGTHNYFAKYLGDANFIASVQTAATSAVVVSKAPVTITGPASPIQIAYASSTTVPLSLAGPYTGPGIVAPTGSLDYRLVQSSNIVASGTVAVSTGSAVVPVPNTLAPGTYSVMAIYEPGDANYAAGAGYAAVATVQVGKIQPVVTFTSPGATFVYGTALNVAATATYNSNPVAGVITYTATLSGGSAVTVDATTVLGAGSYTLTASFAPTDANTYQTASATKSLTVTQATPALAWATPSAVSYGTALGATQLNATATGVGGASLPGTFTYTPAAGNVPSVGSVTLSVQFAPTDSTDYTSATKQVTLTVNQASQAITFKPLATPITYGSVTSIAISATGGGSGNPITFSITGPASLNGSSLTITGAGTITVTANQAGNANYTAAAPAQQTIVVNKATVTVAGPASQPVMFGYTQAGSIPVSVTGQYSGAGIAPPSGSLNYSILNAGNSSVASGALLIASGGASVPVAGTLSPGSYVAGVSYAGDANYLASTTPTDITLQIAQVQPAIQWAAPSPIVYGTSLAGVLNASAMNGTSAISGNFAYSAGTTAITASTLLPAGSYTLSVNFTPADTTVYKSATGSVTLIVNKAMPGVSLASSANPILVKSPTTLTATVSSAVSTPSGTVTFLDGTTPIGNGALVNGVASLTLSSLTTGPHTIIATYSGDSNFLTASSGTLSQHIDDFAIAPGSTTSFTIMPGDQAKYEFTLTPMGDATLPADINLTMDGQPTNAAITFNPSGINAGSGTTNFTVTVGTPSLTGSTRPANMLGKGAGPLALALLLLPFSRRMRRQARKLGRLGPMLLLLIASGAALVGMTGCGVKTGFFAHPQQTYTLTVTGASGALSHSASVTLTVE